MSILVVNAGSSNLKLALFDDEGGAALGAKSVDWPGPINHRTAASRAIQALIEAVGPSAIEAVGHRVVHGGASFGASVLVDEPVKAEIARLAALAPLHNPAALAGIEAVEDLLPGVPLVAAFDTAFYRDLPRASAIYPLPFAWYSEWGIRRFGFHGLSHAHCSERASEMLGRSSSGLRVVSLHLGNGCSATASRDGRAVATTMGFTPLDGLMMGTRAGSVDPGILFHVQRHHGLSAGELEDALNHASGLLGVSGVSGDYRLVSEAARAGNDRAEFALELYAARARSAVGALAVTLGGVDALVFTGGVGENQAGLRSAVCVGLECLGIRLDADRNDSCRPDADVAQADSTARILVVHAGEEEMIARDVRRLAST